MTRPIPLLSRRLFESASDLPCLAVLMHGCSEYEDYLDEVCNHLTVVEGDRTIGAILGITRDAFVNWCQIEGFDTALPLARIRFLRAHADEAIAFDGDIDVHAAILGWHDSLRDGALGFARMRTFPAAPAPSAGAVDLIVETWLGKARAFVESIEGRLDGDYDLLVSATLMDDLVEVECYLEEALVIEEGRAAWDSAAHRELMIVASPCALSMEGHVHMCACEWDEDVESEGCSYTFRLWKGIEHGTYVQFSAEQAEDFRRRMFALDPDDPIGDYLAVGPDA